jgi:hypothetical protein
VPLCSYDHVCIVCHFQINQELVLEQIETAHQLDQIAPVVVDVKRVIVVINNQYNVLLRAFIKKKNMVQYNGLSNQTSDAECEIVHRETII